MNYYILDKHGNPVKEDDVLKWARWFEEASEKRLVKTTYINTDRVSTVFLGIDHNFRENVPPILYETMIFNSDGNEFNYQERYSSKEEALKGHKIACEWLKDRNGN